MSAQPSGRWLWLTGGTFTYMLNHALSTHLWCSWQLDFTVWNGRIHLQMLPKVDRNGVIPHVWLEGAVLSHSGSNPVSCKLWPTD